VAKMPSDSCHENEARKVCDPFGGFHGRRHVSRSALLGDRALATQDPRAGNPLGKS
jgi:hypothetical protein